MPYVATINTPGYLPWDDEPPVFETPREAWDYLAGERSRAEDEQCYAHGDVVECEKGFGCQWSPEAGYSDTFGELAVCGDETQEHGGYLAGPDGLWVANGLDVDGTGTIYGDTPGSHSEHDLGLAYSVAWVEEPEHEIVTSRLTGEAHCTVCGFGGCEKDEEDQL